MMMSTAQSDLHGMVAEFDNPEALVAAAEKARDAGYRRMDAYTPYPIHELSDAIGFHDNKVPWLVATGAIIGTLTGISLQWYTAVLDLPLNIGGKPLFSLPMCVPVTFECTILFSALTGFFSMWILNGLPRPHHPIFSAKNFERATIDRFFLCIEARDPKYDDVKTRDFLKGLSPLDVSTVEEPEA